MESIANTMGKRAVFAGPQPEPVWAAWIYPDLGRQWGKWYAPESNESLRFCINLPPLAANPGGALTIRNIWLGGPLGQRI